MRLLAVIILSVSLVAWTGVRAQTDDGSFNVGAWRGAPVSTDGAFSSCEMQAFFGRREAPVALTIALDRLRGWTMAIRSDQFALSTGQIKAGLAFDDQTPIDIHGDIVNPTTVSFKFLNTNLLDRHMQARKLVLIFSNAALPFALSGFEDATQALKGCVAANTAPAAEQPVVEAAAAAPLPIATTTPTNATETNPSNSRLFSELIEPMIIGFVGSVTTVLLFGGILFQITRIRAYSRYQRLWSAEYRSRVAAHPLSVGLLDMRAAA